MRKLELKLPLSGRCSRRWLAVLAAVLAGAALGSADAAIGAQQQGQVDAAATVAVTVSAATAPGERRVSPHILAAQKRAASAPAVHPSITLQTQMQKRAARRQTQAGTRK